MDNQSEIMRETQFFRMLQDAKNNITSFFPTENEFIYTKPTPEIKISFAVKLKDIFRKFIPKPIFKNLGFLYRSVKRCIK